MTFKEGSDPKFQEKLYNTSLQIGSILEELKSKHTPVVLPIVEFRHVKLSPAVAAILYFISEKKT
jgi:hypothetical protein